MDRAEMLPNFAYVQYNDAIGGVTRSIHVGLYDVIHLFSAYLPFPNCLSMNIFCYFLDHHHVVRFSLLWRMFPFAVDVYASNFG